MRTGVDWGQVYAAKDTHIQRYGIIWVMFLMMGRAL